MILGGNKILLGHRAKDKKDTESILYLVINIGYFFI